MSTTTEVRRENRWTNVMQALWIGVGLQLVCIALPLLDLWVFGPLLGMWRARIPSGVRTTCGSTAMRSSFTW